MNEINQLADDFLLKMGQDKDSPYRSMLKLAFYEGFTKARESIALKFEEWSDYAFESYNMGDKSVAQCRKDSSELRNYARKIRKIGERKCQAV